MAHLRRHSSRAARGTAVSAGLLVAGTIAFAQQTSPQIARGDGSAVVIGRVIEGDNRRRPYRLR